MSADLFAAFGNPSSSTKSANISNAPLLKSSPSASEPDQDSLLDVSSHPSQESHIQRGHSRQPSDEFGAFQSGGDSPRRERSIDSSIWRQDEDGSNVLFDAATEEPFEDNEDEWGDFEAAEMPSGDTQEPDLLSSSSNNGLDTRAEKSTCTSSAQAGTLVDLLSTDSEIPVKSDTGAGMMSPPLNATRGAQNIKTSISRKPPPPEIDHESDEDWGDFADGFVAPDVKDNSKAKENLSRPEQITTTKSNDTSPSTDLRSSNPTSPRVATSSKPRVRPTNIPPPSILLSLFPSILEELHSKATTFISSTRGKSRATPNPNLAYSLASSQKVMARIIAGRSLRWKRDSILSQSTKIGPARSGKAGGMKLNSVNKNETVKEEQETVEAINSWKRRSVSLNNAISAAGGKAVPVPTSIINVRTAATEEGAIKASHACALCGLKRDERIPKVDDGVYDSFGEWWTDHWGHTDCRIFWESYSGTLDQR